MQIEEYARKRKHALKPTTLKVHVSVLRTFQAITGCNDREPSLRDVEYFIVNAMDQDFTEEPLRKTSMVNYLSVIKQYFRLMRLPERDDLHDLYLMMKPSVRQEDYRRVILTEDEVARILGTGNDPYVLACALGYCMCRRVSEVLMLKGTDVKDDQVVFNILKKKEAIKRSLPLGLLPERWRERLLEYKGKRDRVIPVVARTVEYAFKRILKKAGIKKDARFHDLRHSVICHMLDRGVSARVIKDQLSFHENIEIIYKIYGRIPEEAEFQIPRIDWV